MDTQSSSTIIKSDGEKSKSLHDTSYIVALSDEVQDKSIIKENIEGHRAKIKEHIAKIKTIESRIETLRKDQKRSFLLVDSAFKISLRKTKNIYKLHGNLRLDKYDKYGFDQDSRCHYIITQEDYDSYREKHEAFVSLMRIALLQD